jgi:CRP-like cAMP-binding protein
MSASICAQPPSKTNPSIFHTLGDNTGSYADRLQHFWKHVERFTPKTKISDSAPRMMAVVSGWISEIRLLPDGRRQIFSFILPGDVIVTGGHGDSGNRELVTLTHVELADAAVINKGVDPAVTRALMAKIQQDREDRLLDQIVRIGRLSAKERVLNLLLEVHDRLNAMGLVRKGAFRLPVTQELLADALGLSVVHVNRTLQQLRREGLISFKSGDITIHRRDALEPFAFYEAASPTAP